MTTLAGLPLGMFLEAGFSATWLQLEVGDTLFLSMASRGPAARGTNTGWKGSRAWCVSKPRGPPPS